jgi:hypothetical protein
VKEMDRRATNGAVRCCYGPSTGSRDRWVRCPSATNCASVANGPATSHKLEVGYVGVARNVDEHVGRVCRVERANRQLPSSPKERPTIGVMRYPMRWERSRPIGHGRAMCWCESTPRRGVPDPPEE